MVDKRLKRIDNFFSVVSSQIGVANVNPKNLAKARTMFFKEKHDPIFTYTKPDKSLLGFSDILKELSFGDTAIEQLFEAKRKELINKCEAMVRIGKSNFSKKIQKVYPPPSPALVEQARKILSLPQSEKDQRIMRKDAISAIRKVCKQIGIKYRIRSVELATSANISPQKRVLELKKRERFALDYVKRLIVHEIGTHALRSENGALQEYKLFRGGTGNYLETEEGLAVFNEYRSGMMTHSILRNYAGRVIAIDTALQTGFRGTYKALRKYFSEKTAFKLAVRAKRGLKDTSQPGAYTKDVVYLRGFLAVKKWSKRNDVASLYVGKVSLQDLKLMEELPLREPRYVLGQLLDEEFLKPSERRITEEELDALLS